MTSDATSMIVNTHCALRAGCAPGANTGALSLELVRIVVALAANADAGWVARLGQGNDAGARLALTLRAELASRLTFRGNQRYCPAGLAKASLKTILISEQLTAEQQRQIKLMINR